MKPRMKRKTCRECGYRMLAVETICLACEDRAERQYQALLALAQARAGQS